MKKFSMIIASFIFAQCAFAANDIALTAATSKGGSATSIDLVSDGTAAMLQFRINVGAAADSQVDLSACVASLPKSHRGECSISKGVVLGLIYNDEGVALPAGVVTIGKIGVRAPGAALKVVEFLAADKNNAPVQGVIRADAAAK